MYCVLAAGWSVAGTIRQASKVFFSEEKKQKTFHHKAAPLRNARDSPTKVFWFFFSKKNLYPS
jgi:hypothetical protein